MIDSEVYEEDFDDNVSTAETIIQDGSASMWTQIYATGSNYCSGDIIPFTITFGNQGSLEASNVSIRNIIPTQLEYMYGSVPYTHNIVNQYTWDIDGDIYP